MNNEKIEEVEKSELKLFKSDYCKKCGAKFVRFPLKGQPDKSFAENYKEKTILWKNLFKMDVISILFLISLLIMTYGYKTDIAKCNEVIKDPYHYCIKAGCTPNPMLDTGVYPNRTLNFSIS